MIYLSLDQAMRTTGYSIFEDKRLVAYGSFTISGSKPIEQRLNDFFQNFEQRLNDFFQNLNTLYRQFEFDEVFFEDIQNQNNNETYKKLAYVQATIMIWCYNNDMRFHILSPSHWRKILKDECGVSFGRKREEQKEAAIKFIKQTFDKDVTSDEADSIALGYAALLEKDDVIRF